MIAAAQARRPKRMHRPRNATIQKRDGEIFRDPERRAVTVKGGMATAPLEKINALVAARNRSSGMWSSLLRHFGENDRELRPMVYQIRKLEVEPKAMAKAAK